MRFLLLPSSASVTADLRHLHAFIDALLFHLSSLTGLIIGTSHPLAVAALVIITSSKDRLLIVKCVFTNLTNKMGHVTEKYP